MHSRWVLWVLRAIPSPRVSMPLNPYATPFVKGSSSAAVDVGKSIMAAPKVFCDLDGCLVDFEKGCKSVTGETPDKLSAKVMWRGLARAKGFCEFGMFGVLRWGLYTVYHTVFILAQNDIVLLQYCCKL